MKSVRSQNRFSKFTIACAIAFAIAGCKGGTTDPAPPNNGTPIDGSGGNGTGTLFVLNQNSSGGNSILRYDKVSDANGNLAPSATIQGALTQLSNSRFIFYDSANDRLYVANQGANNILVFDTASTKNGNVAPTRVISSGSFSSPTDVVVDTTNNRMYVSNSGTNAILAFANASTISSGAVADATVTSNPPFSSPQGLRLDTTNNAMFVADSGNNSVKVFEGVAHGPSAWTGSIALVPDRELVGSSTLLNQPSSLSLDKGGKLVVANRAGNSLLAFGNPTTVTGNIAPDRSISGSTSALNQPFQIAYDTSTDSMYVANAFANNVLVFSPFVAQSGSPLASGSISGSSTGLSTTVSNSATAVGIAFKAN